MHKIVLAYTGSFASSVALAWLAEQHGSEIVTVTLDVGQGRDLAAVRERALALGAVRAHVVDARDEFLRQFVLPSLQGGAFDAGHPYVAGALVHSLVAKRLVELARMESAAAVAHAAPAESSGERVLRASVASLDPTLEVWAPQRTWMMTPEALEGFARTRGIHPGATDEHSVDANLWGRQVSGHDADRSFVLTREAVDAPLAPAFVDIEFHEGIPVRANGVELSLLELIESLETIAGAHGAGRRGYGHDLVVEAPAAVVLHEAHRSLAAFALGPDLAALNVGLASTYVHLILAGQWFSDVREAIDAFLRIQHRRLNGVIRVRLQHGECAVVTTPEEFSGSGGSAAPRAVA